MIRKGSKVKIHYRLSADGRLMDSSEAREPLTYIQGEGQIVAGLEQHLANLKRGDVTRVEVPPEQAYGARNEDAVQSLPKSAFDDPDSLVVGRMIQGKTLAGQVFNAVVRSIDGDQVMLDLNHPLAGKTLAFEVEILEVIDPEVETRKKG